MIAVEQFRQRQTTQLFDFSRPLAMLFHCHKKVESQLRTLEQVGAKLNSGVLDDRLSAFFAIDMARAYLAGPLLKHTEDEEVSLFPRLRARCGSEFGTVLFAVDELEKQQRLTERLHKKFESLVSQIHRDGSCQTCEIERLDAVVTALCKLYRSHIRIEHELVFPAAARVLLPSDIRAIGEEMQARRRLVLQKVMR